jgi:hypothetical protein
VAVVVDEVFELFQRQSYDRVRFLLLLEPSVESIHENCVVETDLDNLLVAKTIVSRDLEDPKNQLQSNPMILLITSIQLLKHQLSAMQFRSLQD